MRVLLVICAVATVSPAAAQAPDMKGAMTSSQRAGKAQALKTDEVKAQVVSLDRLTRAITLKGPKGTVVDMIAGPEVKNFEQLKVGDFVTVRYFQSLALELGKPGQAGTSYGERPTARGREVRAIAKVTAIDESAKTVSLKGPRGNTVTLDVRNPEHFKVLKVGDDVLVTYTEAVAFSVTPAKN
ncbi:MAG: hypothetical protein JOZ85_16825 [Betaproteobacteria bacterium]|nr:hypothetical protein [Betaproteobacteria bacterium]